MGIDLTKQLFARHAHGLTAGELTVLGYMCVVALDKANDRGQQARLYFGGWEPLALALGYDGLTSAAKEKVRRSIKGCRSKGLIKPLIAHAQTGERQVYRIEIGGKTGARNQSPNRATGSEPQEGHNFRGDRGSETEPPRTQLGKTEDLPQDISIAVEPQPEVAREDIQKHKFKGSPGNDCDECGLAYANRAVHPLHLLRGA